MDAIAGLLDRPLEQVLGKRSAKKLAGLGIETGRHLITHYPRRYAHWGKLTPLELVHPGQDVTILARVQSVQMLQNRAGGVRLSVVLTDGHRSINAVFFAKHPGRLAPIERALEPGSQHLFAGKVGDYQGSLQLSHPQFESTQAQDAREKADKPIPIYPAQQRCPSWFIHKCAKLLLGMLTPQDLPDVLTEKEREERGLVPLLEGVRELHDPTSDAALETAKKTVKWSEALALQVAMLARHDELKRKNAPAINQNGIEQVVADLPFQLTGGQQDALHTIARDMQQTTPMQRLLQADVGAGKTVVAGLAMTAAVNAGYQAALLAPTQVLAQQHAQSLSTLLPVPVSVLTSASSASSRNEALQRAASGQPGIFVGTHALLEDSFNFGALGLVVVDEQHRFGVRQRDKLRENAGSMLPHMLTMTATPIPRTIAITVFGDLDVTTIRELPKGRKTTETYVVPAENAAWMNRMWERAAEEVKAGGRVFVVTPRIESQEKPAAQGKSAKGEEEPELANVADTARELTNLPVLAGIRIGTLHGRMNPDSKTEAIEAFNNGDIGILVTTTVIEVGVDISAASMMVILDAHQFGLSQLHQLRGRVGRDGQKAVCMAVARPALPSVSIKRLQVFADTTDGFELAEADLKLRSEGDVLGEGQSGGRTSLSLLRVMRDHAIIEQARSLGKEIIAADPHLAHRPALAERVENLQVQAQWMERT
ncbi:ATP-dependent DNA helicase RecG [Gleimia hominis]|uniref:Probable DNA 3'-5' helicase RecG n=1 Tax=Gleimia hominis TaxID=595468 RepID=A0ABU3ICN1_9ACTO|nr:ATP-dependent DNA helicase RecG [Gleimia hominis]MDT3768121.1 ATP-dependent DNA helicase RecG [Gleimia hominis]